MHIFEAYKYYVYYPARFPSSPFSRQRPATYRRPLGEQVRHPAERCPGRQLIVRRRALQPPLVGQQCPGCQVVVRRRALHPPLAGEQSLGPTGGRGGGQEGRQQSQGRR